MYAIYNLVTTAGMILLLPYFLVRGLFSGKYLDHVRERLGWRFPAELRASGPKPPQGGTIWIHAVSVGEVLAALPLAREIKRRYPSRRLVVSTTTKTGQRLARERVSFADAVFYFPLDWIGPVRRSLAAVRPAAILIVETEIWPNFLRECRRAGVPVAFVNGRLSERSFRGFRRALSFSMGTLRGFLKRILNDAALFLVQSEQDAARLLALGADPERVVVTGNLKYDLGDPAGTPLSNWLREEMAGNARHPVIVAGSLLAGEESIVLRAFAQVRREYPRSLLILAPRKPERFEAAARIVRDAGLEPVLRSTLSLNGTGSNVLSAPGSVLLLDSVGELASVYGVADVVFVGGSLVPAGGHNILEPAAHGKPPVYGPSMENFREMAREYLEAGAAVEVSSADELAAAWTALLADADRSARMGSAARRLVERNRGATDRVLAQLGKILDAGGSQA
jgi:3-deoxy-D-manno-octulosonic-acid transferase